MEIKALKLYKQKKSQIFNSTPADPTTSATDND